MVTLVSFIQNNCVNCCFSDAHSIMHIACKDRMQKHPQRYWVQFFTGMRIVSEGATSMCQFFESQASNWSNLQIGIPCMVYHDDTP